MTDTQNPTQTPESIAEKLWMSIIKKLDRDYGTGTPHYKFNCERIEEIAEVIRADRASRPAPEAKRSEYEIAEEVAETLCRDFEPETQANIIDGLGKKLEIKDGIKMAIITLIRAERQEGK